MGTKRPVGNLIEFDYPTRLRDVVDDLVPNALRTAKSAESLSRPRGAGAAPSIPLDIVENENEWLLDTVDRALICYERFSRTEDLTRVWFQIGFHLCPANCQ
jgi:hypothetical protein